MDKVLTILSRWEGEFDTETVYQLTVLRHQHPSEFIPVTHPIHRNTGVHVHDVLINHSNERLLEELVHSTLSLEQQRELFRVHYQEPPLSISIRYRHGY